MKALTAASISEKIGHLTQRVYDFFGAQGKAMEAGSSKPSDWDGMFDYIDPEKFKRVGAYLEELNWPEYREFLTSWMAGALVSNLPNSGSAKSATPFFRKSKSGISGGRIHQEKCDRRVQI